MANSAKKLPLFWKIFLISAASMIAIVIVLLIIFWNFMAAYQKSLSKSVLDDTFSNADSGYWYDIISDSSELELSPFESRESVAEKLAEVYSSSEVTYVKKYDEYTDERPVYTLVRSGGKFATVRLKAGDDCGFGFTSWNIDSVELIPEAFEFARYTAEITVPNGAELTVGGVKAGREYYSAAPGSVEYKYISKYEAQSPERPMCDKYSISGLLFDISPTATLDGKELEYKQIGDTYIFDYPESMKQKLVISAPDGAKITLGGVDVSLSPYSSEEYSGGVFEKGSSLPKHSIYIIDGLFSVPQAHAEIDGVQLSYTISENAIAFAYPEELMYTVKVTVPSGATVAVNGITADSQYISETSADAELISKSYSSFIKNIPECCTYIISGLYREPVIEVTFDGKTLNSSSSNVSGHTVAEKYDIPYSSDIPAEIAAEAESFTKAFLYYTACGYLNIHDNMANVLSHTLAYSEAYTNINASYIGVYYNDYYQLIYNKLETTGYIKYSDTCVKVGLIFDTYRKIYTYSVHDEGEYDIFLVYKDGRWLVADFIIK